MEAVGTDAIILGAGPCGLILAASLLNRGHRVRVFDAASGPALQGLDVIKPNGVRALQAMGLLSTLGLDLRHEELQYGWRRRRWQCFNALGDLTCEAKEPGFAVSMSRYHLMNMLLEKVAQHVQWNMQPVKITQQHDLYSEHTCVIVEFSNGAAAVGDWLAGCDGCHSFVRSQVLPAVPPVQPVRLPALMLTGVVRVQLEDTSLAADIIREWAGDEHDSMAIFERPHLRVWVERIGVSRLHWTAVVSDELQQLDVETPGGSTCTHQHACRFAAALMSKLEHPLMAALRKYLVIAEDPSDRKTNRNGNAKSWASVPHVAPLYDMEQFRGGVWGTGQVVLLGAAAHCTVPLTQQALSLAIEDCAVLTLLLDMHEAYEEKHGAPPTHNLHRVFRLLGDARSDRIQTATQHAREVYAANFESSAAGRIWRDILWAVTPSDAAFSDEIGIASFDCCAGLVPLFQRQVQWEQQHLRRGGQSDGSCM